MTNLFTILFYQPIYNGLIALYGFLWNDLAIAIITLTILIKFILLPLSRKQITSQKELQEVQPKIKEIQEEYKGDREKIAKETMALYKEHGINPAAGCLPLIAMVILFFAIYRVIFNLSGEQNFTPKADDLYSFVPHIDKVGDVGLGFLPLGEPHYVLAVITAIASYIQIVMMQKKSKKDKDEEKEKPKKKEDTKNGVDPDFAQVMQKQMLYIIPAMTLFIGFTFPAGLTLYWLTSTVFTIAQQWFITKKA